jgi:hypothetical protein
MRRIVATIALTVSLLTGGIALGTAPASGHTYSAAKAACDWIEVRVWGPNPNNITRLKNSPVHYWGSHQADCRYLIEGPSNIIHCVLVDLITGYEVWLGNCYA